MNERVKKRVYVKGNRTITKALIERDISVLDKLEETINDVLYSYGDFDKNYKEYVKREECSIKIRGIKVSENIGMYPAYF